VAIPLSSPLCPKQKIHKTLEIIAKVLANRLRRVISKAIFEEQLALIGGRNMLDGVLVANEILHETKEKLGFCCKWRMWIK